MVLQLVLQHFDLALKLLVEIFLLFEVDLQVLDLHFEGAAGRPLQFVQAARFGLQLLDPGFQFRNIRA